MAGVRTGCHYQIPTAHPGPLLDRIDIHVEVPRVDYEKLSGDRVVETSQAIRARVQAARDIQLKQFSKNETLDMRLGEINKFRKLQACPEHVEGMKVRVCCVRR